MRKGRKVGYTISTVAEMFHIHPQTLRLYDREGLLKPSRSQGNTRLYLEEDLQRLQVILDLTRGLGVNLAGIEVILHMRKRMEALQREFSLLFNYVRSYMEHDEAVLREKLQNALVPSPPTKIARFGPL
ncbi:MAG: helix-turn-helix transcriptional regulator [Acidobacteria bacterium]|nr:helix-turn-helix transcriptional regulator [Acidobacteriota bacterium]